MTSTRQISELERAVAAQLRAHVAAKRVKKASLAKAVDAHRTHVSRLINGHTHIALDELSAICDALGVRVVDVVAAAADSLPARDALLDQLNERPPPVQGTSDNIRAAGLEPDAG